MAWREPVLAGALSAGIGPRSIGDPGRNADRSRTPGHSRSPGKTVDAVALRGPPIAAFPADRTTATPHGKRGLIYRRMFGGFPSARHKKLDRAANGRGVPVPPSAPPCQSPSKPRRSSSCRSVDGAFSGTMRRIWRRPSLESTLVAWRGALRSRSISLDPGRRLDPQRRRHAPGGRRECLHPRRRFRVEPQPAQIPQPPQRRQVRDGAAREVEPGQGPEVFNPVAGQGQSPQSGQPRRRTDGIRNYGCAGTVISRRFESRSPSAVQIAPAVSQARPAASTRTTSAFESGSTSICQLRFDGGD